MADGYLHSDVSKRILGAALQVHRALGPGFREAIYEEALAREFAYRGIAFQRQLDVPVHYRGDVVGTHRLDLLVEGKVVVELKAVTEFADVHYAIAQSYLAACNLHVALLLNFAAPSLKYKRVFRKILPNNQNNQF